MRNTFELKILAADRPFFEGPVRSFIYTTPFGEEEILANHEENISVVSDGTVRFKTEDDVWHKAVAGVGVVQFVHNRCLVLVNSCEKPEEIDRVRAEAAMERAKERLRQKKSIEEYYLAQSAMARAFARLKETSGK